MVSTESNHYAGWHHPTVGLVWSFTVLILNVNERNWNAGRCLDARERELTDESYWKMKNWVIRQQRRMRHDESLYRRLWTSSDTWWPEEYHERSSEWEDSNGSDKCVTEYDDGQSDTDSPTDHGAECWETT